MICEAYSSSITWVSIFFFVSHTLNKNFWHNCLWCCPCAKKKPVMGLNDDFEPFGINNLLSSEKKNIDLNIQFMWHFQWKYLHLGKILKRISNYCISDLIFYVFFAWNANRIGLMFHALQSYCTIFFSFRGCRIDFTKNERIQKPWRKREWKETGKHKFNLDNKEKRREEKGKNRKYFG